MSMVAKLSDLVDRMHEASLQVDGQVEVPNQGMKDLWETEEGGSSPSLSLPWSPAQRPPLGCPNTKHCLEI